MKNLTLCTLIIAASIYSLSIQPMSEYSYLDDLDYALNIAAQDDNLPAVIDFLQNPNINPNRTYERNRSALEWAVDNSNIKMVLILLNDPRTSLNTVENILNKIANGEQGLHIINPDIIEILQAYQYQVYESLRQYIGMSDNTILDDDNFMNISPLTDSTENDSDESFESMFAEPIKYEVF